MAATVGTACVRQLRAIGHRSLDARTRERQQATEHRVEVVCSHARNFNVRRGPHGTRTLEEEGIFDGILVVKACDGKHTSA